MPGPPPPPARPPLRFDAPFGLLDDDIDDAATDESTATAAAVTRGVGGKRGRPPIGNVDATRRSERQQQRVRGKLLEAPPTPGSAEAMVPSSLPASPASADSAAPTAVNSPVSHAAVSSGRQLIDQLSLLVQRHHPHAEAGGESAAAADTGVRGRARGKVSRPKQANADDSDNNVSRGRRGDGGRAAGRRSKQAMVTHIDTTNAQDIRAFLPTATHSLHAPPRVNESASTIADNIPTVAHDVTLSAPPSPSTSTPPRPVAPTLGVLYPPSLIRSPHIDVAAIRKKFGLERSRIGDSTHTVTATDTLHDERKDSSLEHSNTNDSGSGRAQPVRATAGKRKRGEGTAMDHTTAAASDSVVVVEEGAMMIDDAQPLRTSSTMPFSPTSPVPPQSTFVPIRSSLSRHPTLTDEQLQPPLPPAAAPAAGMLQDDTTSQKLERASTIVVNNNTADELLLRRPTPVHPMTAASTVTRQKPVLSGDESVLRQSSLTSTTSSTSTASADATARLPSTDSASSSPAAVSPCERLPSTFPDFRCERLTTRSGAHTVRCFAATTTGSARQVNQDAFAVMAGHFGRTAVAEDGVCILSVFDGHGPLGHTASRLCAATMPPQVAACLAAEAAVREAKDTDTGRVSTEHITRRLDCVRRSFDSCQQLLLDVARAEQQYVVTQLHKLEPDIHIKATRTCQPMHSPHRHSPPSFPALLIPVLDPPPVNNQTSYEPTTLLPLPDIADLLIPPLVPLRRHEPQSHDDDDVHDTHYQVQSNAAQLSDGVERVTSPALVEAAVARPTAERKKKKRKRRLLGKPRKRASPTPQQQTQPQQTAIESTQEQVPLGRVVSDSESEGEKDDSVMDETSQSVHSLQPIRRSPVKRVPVKQSQYSTSPRPIPSGFTAHSVSAVAPLAVDVDYGTTGLMVVVEGADVYVANAGDSRCVLLEWRGGAIRHGSDVTEVEAHLSDHLGNNRRARSPPAVASRALAGGVGVVSRSLSSPFASFSSTTHPASSLSSHRPPDSPWHTLFTSGDHDPSLPTALGLSEYERVRREGGSVLQLPGQYRVYPDTLTVAEAKSRALTLNMSRALGHLMLSQHGVTHKPDCTHIRLPDGNSNDGSKSADAQAEQVEAMDKDDSLSGSSAGSEVWMLLASDGLWDVMDVDDVRLAIDQQRRHQRNSRHNGRGDNSAAGCKGLQGNGVCLECVCCSLLQSCEARWRARVGGDNITVVLAQLVASAR